MSKFIKTVKAGPGPASLVLFTFERQVWFLLNIFEVRSLSFLQQENVIKWNAPCSHGDVIPDGATYTTADGTVYNSGNKFPETVTTGDLYTYGYYEYRFNEYYHWGNWYTSATQNGWGARYIGNEAEPSPILESINKNQLISMNCTYYQTTITTAPSIPSCVTKMYSTFGGCNSLTDISNIVIPSGVTSIAQMFSNCKSLVDASSLVIPDNVTDTTYTFVGCTKLKTAPVINSTIDTMQHMFEDCTALTGTVIINANPSYPSYSFDGVNFETQNLRLEGSSTKLDTIGATGTNYCAECNGKCQGNH